MNGSVRSAPAEAAQAALKTYDENEAWYRGLPAAEQDGRNYEHYEDTILAVVHELAAALRTQLAGSRATSREAASVGSATSTACPACGTWVCADCGTRRQYASRFSALPQACGVCSSPDGQMLPVRHHSARAEDHRTGFHTAVRGGLVLRYPLASQTNTDPATERSPE